MRRRWAIGALAILGFAVVTAGADDFWVKKDWKTWSKAECKKMLEDSPWAKRFLIENSMSNRQLPSGTNDLATATNPRMGNIGTGEITYFVWLLSARPIRDAFIRQQQIWQAYDRMTIAEKNAFDSKMEKQASGVKEDIIVVRVVFEASESDLGDAVTAFWSNVPPHTVPLDLFLVTEKGTKISPLSYSFVKDMQPAFDVTFPRTVGTELVIAPDARSMKVQFPNPPVGDFPAKTVTAEYKLDKMIWDGKLAY